MKSSLYRNILISLAGLAIMFYGLWVVERSNNPWRANDFNQNDKSAQKRADNRKRVYASNPNLDFDLPSFSLKRDNPVSRPVNIAFEGEVKEKLKK